MNEEQYLLERLYRLGDRINRLLRQAKPIPNAKVISIGNITTGGTGKTPAVIYFAQLLQWEGYHVGILSRGYRGEAMKIGAVLSNGQQLFLTPRESGDEAYLLAVNLRGIPVAVGRNRFASASKLQQDYGVNCFILDDGFQHYSLQRDVDIVLVDATNPYGNGHLIPNGILREPKESLRRSDILILTKCDLVSRSRVEELIRELREVSGHEMVFQAVHRPVGFVKLPMAYGFETHEKDLKKCSLLKGKKVWAISAIANERAFEKTLLELGVSEVQPISYRDHHNYTEKDIENILARVRPQDYVITTEKDWVKLQVFSEKLKILKNFYYLKIKFHILENEILLKEGLKAKILAGKARLS
ncbi:MAG: tetraacyldisaccharide 4'-kinase [Leptospiraceae bacterium]|nr:tetraacyldisaccharide 4'-kinase [Leptospiraceae bacterium]MDW8305865.1 tetraacyldisaccharide 4'-kinase [Leptospiraceae bacterium]